MHEILSTLDREARVLDLGSRSGSFPCGMTRATVIRLDLETPRDLEAAPFVQADAAHLPFGDRCFRAIISSHSLEHIDDLAGAIAEIGRVIHPHGALFVAVPDASTFSDRVYRWLGRGGGHVNPFTSAADLARRIEEITGLPHRATKTLCSSLAFLNSRRLPSPRPRIPRPLRIVLFGAGFEWPLFALAWITRRLDRWLGTRTSVYGWALYFGPAVPEVDTATWRNVCIRCGSGYPAPFLRARQLVRTPLPGLATYRCLQCSAVNPFAED